MVAPVVTQGATSRQVRLPAGTFFPLLGDKTALGGASVQGGQVLTVDAPLAAIPAFVPAGTVLPLLPEAVDTAVAATPSSVTTLAQVGDNRELWLWGGGHSTFTDGAMKYAWQADTWTGPPQTVLWNGKPVALVDGAVQVTLPGSAQVDGKAKLSVAGGKAGTKFTLRFR